MVVAARERQQVAGAGGFARAQKGPGPVHQTPVRVGMVRAQVVLQVDAFVRRVGEGQHAALGGAYLKHCSTLGYRLGLFYKRQYIRL